MLSNKLYDVLKYIALIGLPALATFWTIVGAIWGAPHVDEVVKTIVALGTLLGALLILNTQQYNNSDRQYDGVVDVTVTPDGHDNEITNVATTGTVNDLTDKGKVVLKVRPNA